MFSIFKKSSTEQEVVLQDLTEEQLAQAAGGRIKIMTGIIAKSGNIAIHHHRHHHHHINDHDWDDRKRMKRPNVISRTPFTGHW